MGGSNRQIKELTLVGCGAMGSALLRGWLRSSDISRFNVIAPHREAVASYLDQDSRIQWFASPEDLPSHIECLVIALKPLILGDVLPLYRSLVTSDSLIISVATGKKLSLYKEHLGQDIIRAMPNTPVSVNQGVIGLVAEPEIRSNFGTEVEDILGPLGYIAWVETEDQLNQVTALSGSGPAYVFYMIEAMAKAGETLGLPAKQSYNMALHTVAGAGLYAVDSGLPAATLRENVTSPQGTTEQALKVLMASNGLKSLMQEAIEAAFQRAEELEQ